ncbi:TrmH family RNA methyltransferase [Psychroserpens ponticola]|uniref:RNA methyltransferase n=1 Tax=Psychroserpens ponticola TaxID=2932268 RepID=A0ABY7RVF2_9FLAO|nr:RNA methyltransferase [Psychroserpens ponticola]WCO01106.1 RNA methyltransferase [Psychroserpens ponticola]
MSITKNDIKLIKSLNQKKFRHQEQLFLVEGVKGIREFLNSDFELYQLFATDAIFDVETTLISPKDLQRISALKTPNTGLAIFRIPKPKPVLESSLVLALDDVRDPGNLGTIIRLCDWFGIEKLICSLETVDCYNPKVVQATMGSLTRIQINYTNLERYLEHTKLETFGTFMDGNSIYSEALPQEGVIIMGNEANGISKKIERLISKKIGIPRFGDLKATESLNVATATAIVLSAFKGR